MLSAINKSMILLAFIVIIIFSFNKIIGMDYIKACIYVYVYCGYYIILLLYSFAWIVPWSQFSVSFWIFIYVSYIQLIQVHTF